ncbi:hypothetical protein PAXRUDRAFT_827017 [Paxillus rubicundulus Ve08.2h10]|uniref:GATA-type domain-containing protein n=1 Tax=Paxillus rubicundulus Ve08.2h10 TaxID=930991 RepID=A0A0D0DYT4_9AGAM|nr:hypothetical protein PAXRUDRAFT_827017 [Paxillus rubicundulus Ve08.2h10]
MSFLVPSQRGLVHVTQQSLADFPAPVHNQPPRSHLPLSSYQGLSPQAMSPTPSFLPSFTGDPMPHNFPKLGETRCYWSLLSSDLQFIYLDPVLACHLEDQADLLIGESLLAFVHPEEQSSARVDLAEALEQRTMHGSVTRVRYCRLSRIRRLLGYSGPLPAWSDADKIALDSHYMAVDIVISWAAEGLVLCFVHAIVDLGPADNDEQRKTSWTNWCGTPVMASDQLSLLYQRLQYYCPQPGVLGRVFQILSNSTHQDHRVLLSWPPDTSHEYSNKPSAKDFAKRASGVQTSTHDSSAKTSCTRRWRIVGTLPAVPGEVESVFIPHGTIMFACHTVQPSPRNGAGVSSHAQYQNRPHENYPPHHTQHTYNVSPSSYTLPPVNAPTPSYGSLPSYSSQHWSTHPESSSLLQYNKWLSNSSPTNTLSSLSAPSCSLREAAYATHPSGRLSDSPNHGDMRGSQHGYQPTPSPDVDYADCRGPDSLSVSDADVVPPPRHRVSPGSTREPVNSRSSNRPVGVLKCTSCGVTSSPEWRKGPNGKKELCNACGLRYARSRAKKDGHAPTNQRRKKDKTTALMVKEKPNPGQSSPIVIASAATRGGAFESGSFASASSLGSASGSEVYSQHSPGALESSPSPPSAALNFVHYSHPPPPPPHVQSRNEGRVQFHPNGPFHSASSPLSNQSSQRIFRGHGDSSVPASRLAPYPYVSPSTSSTFLPGANSLAPLSSFERDKGDDRHMPPPTSLDKKYERFSMHR